MKTPKKTFEKSALTKDSTSKKTVSLTDENDIPSNKIIEDDEFNLPLDDLAAFDSFDDDDDDY